MPSSDDSASKILICGPPGMMAALSGNKGEGGVQGEVEGVLKEMGYTSDQVFKY
jgi:cytochrome-b5 reductase